ncbi:MAG TPA: sigma-70 family RNA polymerase sigma factor [Thermoanaerobaculia bacterium]|nr:sigma-70 family RNA polymerase sigma factor [Thermoanaerobaculia bacterium]
MLPESLYVELYPRLVALAEVQYGVPAADSHDVVHDVFIRFVHARGAVDEARAFLRASVANACIDYWRQREKLDGAMPERTRWPRYERAITLRQVLRKLPRNERRVLTLRLQGWKVEEIAARCGRSVSWTEKTLRSARQAAIDLTNRRPAGGGVCETDTYVSPTTNRQPPTVMIRAHVRPVRGPSLPRAARRASVFRAHRRVARQVRREFSGARGLVPAPARVA